MEKNAKGKIDKFRTAHGLPAPQAQAKAANIRVKRQIPKTMG